MLRLLRETCSLTALSSSSSKSHIEPDLDRTESDAGILAISMKLRFVPILNYLGKVDE